MKIRSENLLGSSWVDEVGEIISGNLKKKITVVFLIVIWLMSIAIPLVIGAKIFVIIIWLLFFIGLIFIISKVSNSIIQLDPSELLAYYLFGLFVRIEKYDGKKDHISKEGTRIIKKIKNIIDDYTDKGTENYYPFFNFEESVKPLVLLDDNLKKCYTLFKFYDSNKEQKDKLKKLIQEIAFGLYKNKRIAERENQQIKDLDLLEIKKIEVVNETWEKIKDIFNEKIKDYFKYLIFCIIVLFTIWYLVPQFYPDELSTSAKLLASITLLGTGFAAVYLSRKKS